MSFVSKLKSAFKSKGPLYKTFTPAELKVVAMRTRIILEEQMKKSYQKIRQSDSILTDRKNMGSDTYKVMQEIGKNVIEVESIKIYLELLKKIEDNSALIVKTNGDIALLKTELQWFQAILWYRKCREVHNMEEIYNFCYNFFKGIDVTMEINVKCDIFKIFDIIRYLDPNCIIPLKRIYSHIVPYLQKPLDSSLLDEIFRMNRQQIRMWFKRQRVEAQEKYLSKSRSRSPLKNPKTPPKQSFSRQNSEPLPMEPKAAEQKIIEKEQAKDKKQQPFKSSFGRLFSSKATNSKITAARQSSQSHDVSIKKNEQIEQLPKQIEEGLPHFGESSQSSADILSDEYRRQSDKEGELFPKSESYYETKPQNEAGMKIEDLMKSCSRCGEQYLDMGVNDCGTDATLSFGSPDAGHASLCDKCYQQNFDILQGSQVKEIQPVKQQSPLCKDSGSDIGHMIYSLPDLNPKASLSSESDNLMPDSPNKKLTYSRQVVNEQNKSQSETEKNHVKQAYDDENESLGFIRDSVQDKKKGIKKPYMVSIYARAQFVNKA